MAQSRKKTNNFEKMIAALRKEFKGRLFPPLGGYVYRFTIYLPLLSKGKEVFSGWQRTLLADLFHDCFAGFSETAGEGHPPWYGSWLPPGASRPVVDRHTLMVLYAPQIEEAKEFFRRLRWLLEQDKEANQDVILIEHTTAWLVEATSFSVDD
jgi:hypothetical protein